MVGMVGRSSRLVELTVAHTLDPTTTSCCRGLQLRGTEASGPGLASPASVASPEAEDRQRGRQHHARALCTSPNQPPEPLVRGTEVGAKREGGKVSNLDFLSRAGAAWCESARMRLCGRGAIKSQSEKWKCGHMG